MNTLPAPIVAAQALAEIRALLASDAYAVTFESLSAYRCAMQRTVDAYIHGLTNHAPNLPPLETP